MPQDAHPTRDEAEVSRLIERLAAPLVELGMPRMPARVFFAILVSPDGALTAAEIAERLSVSPAAVSKAVQYLVQVHLIHREYVPGSRRDRYRAVEGLWTELLGFRGTWLKSFIDAADDGIRAVGGPETAAGARLAETRDFWLFALEETTSLIDRWRAHRTRQRPARP